ncbi:uncharacterized protein M6G45_015525 [Spheniscus humboldti]
MKADLFQGEAEGGTAEQELIKWEPWSELAEALQEQVEVKKLLRNKLQRLQERREGLQEPAAFRGKTGQAEETNPSLLQEMVAVRLVGQTTPLWALGREGSALCPGDMGALISAGMREGV